MQIWIFGSPLVLQNAQNVGFRWRPHTMSFPYVKPHFKAIDQAFQNPSTIIGHCDHESHYDRSKASQPGNSKMSKFGSPGCKLPCGYTWASSLWPMQKFWWVSQGVWPEMHQCLANWWLFAALCGAGCAGCKIGHALRLRLRTVIVTPKWPYQSFWWVNHHLRPPGG